MLNEQFSPQFCRQSSAFTDGMLHDPEDLKVLDLPVTTLQGYYESDHS